MILSKSSINHINWLIKKMLKITDYFKLLNYLIIKLLLKNDITALKYLKGNFFQMILIYIVLTNWEFSD